MGDAFLSFLCSPFLGSSFCPAVLCNIYYFPPGYFFCCVLCDPIGAGRSVLSQSGGLTLSRRSGLTFSSARELTFPPSFGGSMYAFPRHLMFNTPRHGGSGEAGQNPSALHYMTYDTFPLSLLLFCALCAPRWGGMDIFL